MGNFDKFSPFGSHTVYLAHFSNLSFGLVLYKNHRRHHIYSHVFNLKLKGCLKEDILESVPSFEWTLFETLRVYRYFFSSNHYWKSMCLQFSKVMCEYVNLAWYIKLIQVLTYLYDDKIGRSSGIYEDNIDLRSMSLCWGKIPHILNFLLINGINMYQENAHILS